MEGLLGASPHEIASKGGADGKGKDSYRSLGKAHILERASESTFALWREEEKDAGVEDEGLGQEKEEEAREQSDSMGQ